MIMKLEGRREEDKLFCIKVPAVVNFPVAGVDGKNYIASEFRPVECLYGKCAAYWCEEHTGCLEKCRHVHENEIIESGDTGEEDFSNEG